MKKCLICGRKSTGTYCQEHQRAIDTENRQRKAAAKPKAVKYLAYHGHVVALRNSGSMLVPSYYGMSIAKIPKGKLVDLDGYVEGFSRKEIKRFKSVVLALSG